MKQKFILTPINTNVTTFFQAIVKVSEAEQRALTPDMQVVKIKDAREAFTKKFEPNTPNGVFIIEYDDEKIKPNTSSYVAYERNKFLAVELIKDHPQVKNSFGYKNPNLKQPIFVLNNFGLSGINNVNYNEKRFKAYAKFDGFDLKQKSDCTFYYGRNGAMTLSDIMMIMADFSTGVIMQKTDYVKASDGNMGISYIDHFIDIYSPEDNTQALQMNVRKALQSGVFEKRADGYYLDTTHVGYDEASMFNYFHANNKLYEYLQTKVDGKVAKDNITSNPQDDEALRAQAKKLGIATWGSTSIPKLKEKIKEKIKEKELA